MLVSLAIVAAAIGFGLYVLHRSSFMPSTDDASIDAEMVHVAAEVGGRIIDIPVEENSHVGKDDLLFQIDPMPYQVVVNQARAKLEIAKAALETRRRFLSTQQSTAAVAADQTRAGRDQPRPCQPHGRSASPARHPRLCAVQQLDQAETTQRDATTSLAQAREQQAAAVRAIDTDEAAIATVQAAQAELAIAERHLQDTPSVRRMRDGSSGLPC